MFVQSKMAAASYDQLLKQVEALKMENSNLRQELEDNSNHLTKLETEASNMKQPVTPSWHPCREVSYYNAFFLHPSLLHHGKNITFDPSFPPECLYFFSKTMGKLQLLAGFLHQKLACSGGSESFGCDLAAFNRGEKAEVLKQLQGSIEEDTKDSQGQIDFLERLKEINLEPSSFSGVKLRPKASMPGSSSGHSADSSPMGSFPRRGVTNGGRDSAGYLEELEKERSLLMAELQKEEKEKDWYYAQLQNLTKRIDSLPLTENFSLQTDMTRRQLEYEARQIRAAMEEQLGTCQDMEKRAQVRLARIQQIEKDMLRLRQHLQSQPSETEVSSSRVDHDTASEMSSGGSYSVPRRLTSHLGTKVEMVYSLLSMLGTHDKDDMSRTLLAMSSSQDSCIAMRQSGCLPLLIQLLHGNDKDSVLLGNSRGSKEARARASAALHNIIHSQPDDKRGRREIRVLHLLEQIRAYCETCWEWQESHERGVDQDKNPMPSPMEHQICPAVCVLMKLSFDEEHRHAMNELGGLQAIGELLQVDCEIYGLTSDHYSVTLRRYAGMALTNLTFGDVANKATLCSMKGCMRAMVAQLKSESEDLQQVIASVLRNLSWRADVNSKKTLREVGSVRALMECALEVQKESTLKSVLSALWNLSAHCTENKADICSVAGALAFLVSTLTYRSQTNTLAIIESGGGILRNVSSLIATNEEHRQILRESSCLQTLLQHLKSHSLTIVSNACGTLWNLSARNAKDQEALWDMGAVSMLKNLIHSKHKMIAMGSAAALRNLMANRPAKYKDANIMSPGSSLPSLHVRKQKALIEELDAQHLSETFDNIDNLSPKASHRSKPRHKHNVYGDYDGVCRSDGFNTSGVGVRSPYMNTPVLSSPSSRENRGNADIVRAERDKSLDRERRGILPDSDPGKRIAMQIPTTAAQIAMVMEEVQNMHLGLDDRNAGSTPDPHIVQDDLIRHQTGVHGHQNMYNYSKPDASGRPCPMPKLEYRASNDSLNSVSSTDGYGKRGQMKPSVDSYSEDDEGKWCVYRKYPADLAHKIHNANHMEDDDGDLDTPINYSLKYSDEQLNSGRQSPSQSERCTSVSSLDSFESHSIASSVQSEPYSGMVSGIISPSDLPDSPGQTMPPSRSKTPPPPPPQSTPEGFSCASSLSALSLDEPFIQKDVELKIMPPLHEDDHGNKTETEKDTKESKRQDKPPAATESEKDILDDSDDDDDDREILEASTSLSDLTIDSPPNELAAIEIPAPQAEASNQRRDTIPEGKSAETTDIAAAFDMPCSPGETEGDDILAECINSAMPKGFAFDSPHHYTPIEGTPYCFSRNDSLSSLDFEDDDLDLSKEKAELRKDKEQRNLPPSKSNGELSGNTNSVSTFQTAPAKALQKPGFSLASKENTGTVPDEKQNFSIEDTPVCFSRNSSLSSLSDIDQENNNKDCSHKEDTSQVEMPRPQASGYAPKAFHVEDTPVCFSRNSSLSSLSIDSEDDLLQECISSAMPKKKKQPPRSKSDDQGVKEEKNMLADGILAEEPDLILDLTDTHSPISEQALSPDSESFDWKAIQEGANSIVSSLHQAAASLSRQGSSDSDSILSLKSGISIGSPFHLPSNQDENKPPAHKGPRILKPGEKSTLETKKKEEDAAKSLKGGKKVYKSLITGKPRPSLETMTSHQRQAQVPAVSRGRTMVHVPGVRSSSPSTSPIPKKPPTRGQATKPPAPQAPNSGNSPRTLKTPSKSDPSLAREPAPSQGGSSKTSSRSGSRDSTPSRPPQQSLARPMQSPGRTSASPVSLKHLFQAHPYQTCLLLCLIKEVAGKSPPKAKTLLKMEMGLAIRDGAIPKPGSNAAAQDALNGPSVEHGQDRG
ncbi:hypothetical protein QTP86_015303, partial [Hemibagrus guttatus]